LCTVSTRITPQKKKSAINCTRKVNYKCESLMIVKQFRTIFLPNFLH
jgi:hypothetical protein